MRFQLAIASRLTHIKQAIGDNKMSHLTNAILFALLSTSTHALPGFRGAPFGYGKAHKGGSAGHFHPANNSWRHDLDLDKIHPICPEEFPEILFYDNFGTYEPGSQPDPSKWTIDIGTKYDSPDAPENWGTQEIQHYTNSPENLVITDERTLRITPLPPTNAFDKWTSARIETTAEWDFGAKQGQKIRIQSAIKLGDAPEANQKGIWPAFWSLGSHYRNVYNNWPLVGEIDMLESVNGLSTAWQVLHCGIINGGPCDETNGLPSTAELSRGEWHVISLDIDRTNPSGRWEDEEIVWRIDGEVVFAIKGSDVGEEEYWLNITDKEHMILLNVAVGGGFPDRLNGGVAWSTPNDDTVGGIGSSLESKYVAVFATR